MSKTTYKLLQKCQHELCMAMDEFLKKEIECRRIADRVDKRFRKWLKKHNSFVVTTSMSGVTHE